MKKIVFVDSANFLEYNTNNYRNTRLLCSHILACCFFTVTISTQGN